MSLRKASGWRWTGPLLVLLLSVGPLSGCGMGSFLGLPPSPSADADTDPEGLRPGQGREGVTQVVKDLQGIKLVLQTEKGSYLLGEPVPLKLEVANTREEAVEFTFPSGQRFDFLIERAGKEVWRWSFGKQFIQVFTSLTLEPGQSVTYEVEWPQVDNAGRAVPPGSYAATALLTATEPLESGTLTIRIKSE